jgi:thiol:disulfide interchange protein DsbG
MHALKFVVAVFTVILLLHGCKDGPGNPGATQGATAPVSIAAIEAEARGLTVGSQMSARTVYVFFDPQCPHCAALWEAAKPLKPQARFVWIPVGLMNKASVTQGATILAAKDPIAAMDEHEASMLAQKGGISAAGDIEPLKEIIARNTALMNRFGFASIPTIVAQHAQSGKLVTNQGGMSTTALAGFLGLDVPAGK